MLFKNIIEVDKALQLEVLEWRNNPEIRKHMYVSSVISQGDHMKWLDSLKHSNRTVVYVAYEKETPIGIASVNNISHKHLTAEWAFYLSPSFLKGKGLGTLLEYHFLDFIFERHQIEKLNCEVLAINPSVITLHKKFGFVQEGIKRANIIKNEQRIDVVLLGILQSEWAGIRRKFTKVIKRLEQ